MEVMKKDAQKPTGRRIVRAREGFKRAGLSTSTGYEKAKKGEFLKPFKITPGGRASGFFEDELDAYLEARASEGRA